MYSLPSTSQTRAPLAFSTKNGCPPTARNARTGELTPPGMNFNASANNASDLAREIMPAKLFDLKWENTRKVAGEQGQLTLPEFPHNLRKCCTQRRPWLRGTIIKTCPTGRRIVMSLKGSSLGTAIQTSAAWFPPSPKL